MLPALTTNTVTASKAWAGGAGVLSARGTFGSGTLKLEACDNDSATAGDWIDVGSGSNLCSLTAEGSVGFCVPAGWFVRASLSGATSPNVVCSMDPVLGRAAAV